MKARYSPFTSSERKMMLKTIDRESSQFIEEKRQYITTKIITLICLALNEHYKFGRKRLCKLIYQVGKVAMAQVDWEDIGTAILAKRLRRIKMHELADALELAEQDILLHKEET